MPMKISICVPVYNARPMYLKRAISSVLAQIEGFELEIIVNDDHSSIDYSNVISEIFSDKISFYSNSKNIGMVENWNRTVERSRGDLVLVLGQDDILASGMLKTYYSEFNKKKNIVLCGCARRFIDENDEYVELRRAVNDRKHIFVKKPKYILTSIEVMRLCLLNGNAIGEPSAVMFKRSAFDKVGGYDPKFSHAADVDFNVRVSKTGDILYINRPFLLRRIHDDNLTKINFLSGRISRERQELFKRYALINGFFKNEVSLFKRFLVFAAFHDLVRAVYFRKWNLVLFSMKNIISYFELSPVSYARYAKEIITKKNDCAN